MATAWLKRRECIAGTGEPDYPYGVPNSWATTERNSSHSLEVSSSRSGKKKNLSVVGDSMAALVKSAGAPGIVQNWWKPSALAFR